MVVELQTSTTNFSKKLDHWIPNMIDRSGLMQVFAGLEGMGGKSHHGDFAQGDVTGC